MVKKKPNLVNIVSERPLRVSMVMTIHNNLLNNTMKAYTNGCTGSSRLMRISLLRISLLRFFKTITKI